ncbi:MAG: hypothetical protein IKS17_10120 [Firmicutes bacterium]|nr:hypothetical protein [Bacillota bacterium]
MNDLVRITQSFGDPVSLKKDAAEAAALITQHFRQKYVAPVKGVYAEKRAECLEKPSPNVVLLQACRPFVKNTAMLDKMIESMAGCEAAAAMIKEYTGNKEKGEHKAGESMAYILLLAMILR